MHSRRNYARSYDRSRAHRGGLDGNRHWDRSDKSIVSTAGLQFSAVSPTTMGLWTGVQVLGLFYQWMLWQEAKGHLELYEQTLATQCGRGHLQHGICEGPLWNISAWERFALEGWGLARSHECWRFRHGVPERYHKFRHRHRHEWLGPDLQQRCRAPNHTNHSFEFATRSSPPTFLVVIDAVALESASALEQGRTATTTRQAQQEPQDWETQGDEDAQAEHAEEISSWSLRVERVDPPPTGAWPFVEVVSGTAGVITIEDQSEEAAIALKNKGAVRWKARIENRAYSRQKIDFEAFVEDALSTPSGRFKDAHCSFVLAWKRFSQQHQGHRHDNASLSSAMLGFFLQLSLRGDHQVLRRGPVAASVHRGVPPWLVRG